MNPTFRRLVGSAGAWSVLLLPCVVQAGTAQPVPTESPASEALLLPSAAVAAATQIHPAVVAAEVDLERARGAAAQVQLLLRNPQVSAATSIDGRRASGSVSQPISLTGEGIAARRSAAVEVEVAQLRLSRSRLEAAAACRQAYIEAVVRARQVDIAVEGRHLATRLRDAVALQLDVGEASTLDLRLAELAVVQASARLLEARRAEANALRSLSALAGVPVEGASLVSDPRLAAPLSISPPTPSTSRSDLRAQQGTVALAAAERVRQRASILAPVGLGVALNLEDGERFVGPTVQATLPLFDRNQGDRWSAAAAHSRAVSLEHSLQAQILTEQTTAWRRVAEAQELEGQGLRDPLEQARAALVSISKGYRAGEIDLPSAILLQKEVLVGESAALTLLGGIAEARVDLLLAHDDPNLLADGDRARSGDQP